MSSVIDLIKIYNSGLYTSTDRSTYIEVAEGQVSKSFYGKNYNLAVCLMACHIFALNNRPGNSFGIAGNVTSLDEGDLSIGFGSGNLSGYWNNTYLSQTTFGMQLMQLKRQTFPGVSVTGICATQIIGE